MKRAEPREQRRAVAQQGARLAVAVHVGRAHHLGVDPRRLVFAGRDDVERVDHAVALVGLGAAGVVPGEPRRRGVEEAQEPALEPGVAREVVGVEALDGPAGRALHRAQHEQVVGLEQRAHVRQQRRDLIGPIQVHDVELGGEIAQAIAVGGRELHTRIARSTPMAAAMVSTSTHTMRPTRVSRCFARVMS